MARLAEVKDRLGDAVGRDIFFISEGVDRARHAGPAQGLRRCITASAPGWQLLTGRPEDIKAINAKFGDHSATRELTRSPRDSDRQRRDSAFGDVGQRAITIRLMDPKWRDRPTLLKPPRRAVRFIISSAISRVRPCSRRSVLPVIRSAAAAISALTSAGLPIAATMPGSSTS
jgi:hypothetical protein